MMVKEVPKFHRRHLGGWDMLECVSIKGFIQDFEEFFLGGGGGGRGKLVVEVRENHSPPPPPSHK